MDLILGYFLKNEKVGLKCGRTVCICLRACECVCLHIQGLDLYDQFSQI
jgi:hypothetical protein